MKIKVGKITWLAISVLLITLSISKPIINIGAGNIVEYSGLLIILIGMFKSISFKKNKQNKQNIRLLGIVLFVFSIGLILQDMDITKKIELVLSMFILSSIAIMPSPFMNNHNVLKAISNAIMLALVISCVMSLVTGVTIVTGASEGIIVKYGFDCGLEHRNYYSYTVFAAFMCDYLFMKITRSYSRKPMLFIEILLMLVSNSRSALLLLAIFFIICNFNKIRTSKHCKSIIVSFMILLGIIVGVPIYKVLATNSETFFFRINGLNNYLSMYRGDMFHILFGNAAMAFKDSGLGYDYNIRSVIGWNGSTELVILNVMIKNGVIGFIGYFLIFRNSLKKIITSGNTFYSFLAMWTTFLISAFVESYVANINYIYTIVCYMVLANVTGLVSKNKESVYK